MGSPVGPSTHHEGGCNLKFGSPVYLKLGMGEEVEVVVFKKHTTTLTLLGSEKKSHIFDVA